MSSPSVSVCFPSYNEERTITDVLREADRLLSQSGLDYEILVCDDASSDASGAIIATLESSIPNLRVLHHKRNLGIRATFEHLYSEASKQFVFLNSTDLQWDTAILFELLPFTDEWDVIIASRRRKHYGPVRLFVSWAFNAVPLMLFGVRTFDAGAVKLTRREIIQRFSLVSKSPFSEAERLIRAARAGYRITEHPVETSPRKNGRANGVNAKVVVEALADIIRVFMALRRERTNKIRLFGSVRSHQTDITAVKIDCASDVDGPMMTNVGSERG